MVSNNHKNVVFLCRLMFKIMGRHYVSSPDESGYYACGGGYASSTEECESNPLSNGVATIDATANI